MSTAKNYIVVNYKSKNYLVTNSKANISSIDKTRGVFKTVTTQWADPIATWADPNNFWGGSDRRQGSPPVNANVTNQ